MIGSTDMYILTFLEIEARSDMNTHQKFPYWSIVLNTILNLNKKLEQLYVTVLNPRSVQ